LHAPEQIVHVIHWGADLQAALAGSEGETIRRATLGINGPYFFAFGGSSLRKNTARIVSAYASVAQRLPSSLVLAGLGDDGMRQFCLRRAAELGIQHRVLCMGYVSDRDVSCLYRGATAFLYPSLYEGFGLPPLEAMTHGCPVIASDRTSVPEVVGNAAVLVNPEDEQAIAAAMTSMATDQSLRAMLIARGRERAKRFSWRSTCELTVSVLERCLGGRS
jgi:glycosyltransferase involved in cell wall biosynthesis